MDMLKTRILIVEDNSDDEFLLMRQLRKAGLDQQVKVLANGQAAVEFLEGPESTDNGLVAMFLDLKLPSMDGITVLERIRANPRIRDLPVVVMTSSNSSTDMEKCRQLGVSSYVQKPVTFQAFTKAVADTFHASPTKSDELPAPARTIE